jgi:hypothetical protein
MMFHISLKKRQKKRRKKKRRYLQIFINVYRRGRVKDWPIVVDVDDL